MNNYIRVGEHYRKWAKQYGAFAPASLTWKYIEQSVLSRNLKSVINKTSRILEAGCGTGRIIGYLIKKGASENKITGVDTSEDMLAQAKVTYPAATFIVKDLRQLSSMRQKFDVIVCSMVLGHIDTIGLRRVLKNFSKLLKNNGALLYICAHPLRIVFPDVRNYQKRGWRNCKTPWKTKIPEFHRTVSDYINETIQAGFCIEKIEEPALSSNIQKQKNAKELKRYLQYGAVRLVVRARKV